jgi:molybdopterin-biosynthesis enzyme MoeA-like protein
MLGNVIVMAGIPSVMQAMLEAVTGRLRTGKKVLAESIDLHRPEGEIAAMFEAHQRRYPEVAMGSYPFYRDGRPGTQLVLRSSDAARLEKAKDELLAELNSRGWL